MIDDLKSILPLLKLPIINVHAHSNACVHQIANENSQLHFYWKIAKIKCCTVVDCNLGP